MQSDPAVQLRVGFCRQRLLQGPAELAPCPVSLQWAEGSSSQEGSYLWSRAFDANSKPSVDHVFAATSQPVAYASVISLSSNEQGEISFNSMRDLLLPVTASARKAASADHEELEGFQSLSDQVITDSDHNRGIREIFDYDLGTAPETFDLTVMTNSDTTKLFLLVQCTRTCFASNYKQISDVVDSFTGEEEGPDARPVLATWRNRAEP